MRTREFEIAGRVFLLVMNNQVLEGMERQGINLQDIGSDKPVSNLLCLLHLMITGGRDYAALTGAGDYPEISAEHLAILTGPEDYGRILEAITEVATGERRVDATPPKKADPADGGQTV